QQQQQQEEHGQPLKSKPSPGHLNQLSVQTRVLKVLEPAVSEQRGSLISSPTSSPNTTALTPTKQTWRMRVAAMVGREEGALVYDVDCRPPKSTELYDPYASDRRK
ncbi:hypothetical protein BX616_003384, partial [Lobosporangium transversale]